MKPKHPVHPYLLLAPTLLVLGLFFLYPLGVAAHDSFYRWDLLTEPRYVGLTNYRELSSSGALGGVILRTLGFAAVVVVGASSLGLVLALALDRPGKLYARSSAPTSCRGSRSRCSGCGSSMPTRAS